ncbi:MAG TPA: hypothetical protein VHD83_20990 [Puia sp.]|nr:hypothetical protein [Puia sp.]
MSINMLDYTLLFLLKYYRGEVGEVDHIDLGFEYGGNKGMTLTIKLDISWV